MRVCSFLMLVVIGTMAMMQVSSGQKLDELTLQRLNVVDANGTLRVVVSGAAVTAVNAGAASRLPN